MHSDKRNDVITVPPDRADEPGKNKETALAGLRELCVAGEGETPALKEAAKAVARAGWGRDAEQVYLEMLDMPGVNPGVGALWVQSFTSRGAWQHRRRLRKFNPGTPVGRQAWYAYFGALAKEKRADLIDRALDRYGELLRADTVCWGQAGYALATSRLYKETVEWMREWRAHPDATPWILFNAALAFRYVGNDAEGRAINRHALTLADDHTARLHRIWLACDAASTGDFDAARAMIAGVTGEGLNGLNEAAYALTMAMLAMEAAPQDQRMAVYREQRQILKQPRFQSNFRTRALTGHTMRGIGAMARAAGARAFRVGGSGFSGLGRQKISGSMLAVIWVGVLVICALAWYLMRGQKPPASAPVLAQPFAMPTPARSTYRPIFVSPLDQPGQFQVDFSGKLHGGPAPSATPSSSP